jgi:hypothetical protein
MNTNNLRLACAAGLGMLLLGGCTTQPRRVSCEERLEPINAPAPKVVALQEGKSPQPESAKGGGKP